MLRHHVVALAAGLTIVLAPCTAAAQLQITIGGRAPAPSSQQSIEDLRNHGYRVRSSNSVGEAMQAFGVLNFAFGEEAQSRQEMFIVGEDRVMGFPGDMISVPIKITGSADQPREYRLRVWQMLKSGQNGPVQDQHWINGYTPDRALPPTTPNKGEGSGVIADQVIRTQPALPLTKIYRFGIAKNAQPGQYLLRFEFIDDKAREAWTQNMYLTVHDALEFGAVEATRVGAGKVRIVVRDLFGSPMHPDQVSVFTREGGDCIALSKTSDGYIGDLGPKATQSLFVQVRSPGFVPVSRSVMLGS